MRVWLATALAGLFAALPLQGLAAPDCRPAAPRATPAERMALPAGTRIGLALGSGSMHGYAHIGALQEIEARGLPVEVVAGTSVGAIMGGLWASGIDARRIESLARENDFEQLVSLGGSWQALATSVEAAIGGRPIETWPRRFGAVATNVANGERRLIVSGDAMEAIRASTAVPVLFSPVVLGGERLIDGALVEPVPAAAARELGANLVIAIDVAYRPHEEEARGFTHYAFQAMHILVNSLAVEQLRNADVAIRLNLHQRWKECGRDGLVAAGREAIAQAWPEISRALLARAQGTPRAGRPR